MNNILLFSLVLFLSLSFSIAQKCWTNSRMRFQTENDGKIKEIFRRKMLRIFFILPSSNNLNLIYVTVWYGMVVNVKKKQIRYLCRIRAIRIDFACRMIVRYTLTLALYCVIAFNYIASIIRSQAYWATPMFIMCKISRVNMRWDRSFDVRSSTVIVAISKHDVCARALVCFFFISFWIMKVNEIEWDHAQLAQIIRSKFENTYVYCMEMSINGLVWSGLVRYLSSGQLK